MRVAITGAAGQLGLECCRQLGSAAIALDLPDFDITDAAQVLHELERLQPQAIINCAAYTQVDRAEQEPEACRAVNAEAVGHLAQAARRLDCPLIQISTDYVFGAAPGTRPRLESDLTAPRGVYAQTKWEGEQRALEWDKSFVVRTCGLYGHTPRRNNFVETMLKLGRQRSELAVVHDQHCTPTFAAHLTRALRFLLASRAFGVYHVVNSGATTWFDFAREIFRQACIEVEVKPITTAEYGAAAPRPAYSVLDTSKYHALGGPAMPAYTDALAEYLATRAEQTEPQG